MAQRATVGPQDDTATQDSSGHPRSRWRLNRRLQLILAKFATTSVIATLVSQLVVAALFWTHITTAGIALAASYVVGGAVAYFLNRQWTWRKRGKNQFKTEVLPYIALITVCGIGTVGISKLIHLWVGPMVDGTPLRGIALNACLFVASGIIVVLKFLGMNRLFGSQTPTATP